MILNKNKSILSYITAIMVSILMINCTQEDNIGDSTLNPTSPELDITVSVSNVVLIENNQSFEFVASISEPQLVDIKLYAFQIAGDASSDDYELSSTIVIPAGSTSAVGTITILNDELREDTETLTIQIGDNKTANTANQMSAEMQFEIINYTEGDLIVDLDWAMAETTTNNSGEPINPVDFADMRLLLSNAPNNVDPVQVADGSSFETMIIPQTLADGTYYLVSDFSAADTEIIRSLNLNMELNQVGLINHEMRNYNNAITNEFICEANYYVMASVEKSGDTYTIVDVRHNNILSQTIAWGGTDVKDYYAPDGWDSHVVTSIDCVGNPTIAGLNFEWMQEVWGETIEEEGVVYYTVDSAGNVTIEEQYIFTTLYGGSLYDYTVSGTGILNQETGELDLQYNLFQDGWSVDGYWFGAGGLDNPYFEANLVNN